MSVRRIIFWTHLTAGIIGGAVILVMSVTGGLLAFAPRLVAAAERHSQHVTPASPDAKPLPIAEILDRIQTDDLSRHPTAITVQADRTASWMIRFGRDGLLFVNPYTGDSLGNGSKTRAVLQQIEQIHRWLGAREIGHPITGACTLLLLGLAVTGLGLWWSPQNRRYSVWCVRSLRGKARHWNRHNVIGFWCAPVIIILTLTGTIMSYQWANRLLYLSTGNSAPPVPADRQLTSGQHEHHHSDNPPPNIDLLLARAEQQAPDWVSMSLPLSMRADAPVAISIQEPAIWRPNSRSQLTLNPVTGAVVKWEPFASQNSGRQLRSWIRPIHTGEAGGWIGQTIVCLAAVGVIMLVWTGWRMAWLRLVRQTP